MSGTLTPSTLRATILSGLRVVRGVREASLLKTVACWRARHRGRVGLSELPPHLLRDVGLTPEEAAAEWQKPFWR